MTAGTRVMDLAIRRIDQRWRITMAVIARSCAGSPGRTGRVHYILMVIWCCRMDRLPGVRMTRRTVAAASEGKGIGVVSRYQGAGGGIMTAGAHVMRISLTARQGIIMTVEATGRAGYSY